MEASPFKVLGTPERVVLASVDNHGNGSPISPMANLKLLTKVALYGPTSMDENNISSDIILQPHKLKKSPVRTQRQLRSLGFICKKFLELYCLNVLPGHPKPISLGQLTELLEIEKRRIYDIINIIASLRYAFKVCKDKYYWFGNQFLIPTLCELRTHAFHRNYHLFLHRCLNNNFVNDHCYDQNHNKSISSDLLNENKSEFFDDNRIGALCQKSMMLFLIAPKGEPLNFKIISHIILPKDVQDKTGMRRLYDISNVLESLGLIRRCESKHMKRPTFIYSGPELPEDVESVTGTALPDIKHISDASSKGCESKISNIFEVVGSEIEQLEKQNQIHNADKQTSKIPAKKQLFPEKELQSPYGFIRAPQSSFRLASNSLIKIPPQNNNSNGQKKFETQSILTPAFYDKDLKFKQIFNHDSDDKTHNSLIRINRIAKPVTVLKFPAAPVQNGSIYKVVKQGKIINLVRLKAPN